LTPALVGFTAAMVVALVWAESDERSIGRVLKGVASAGFIAVAISVGALETGYGRAVLVALALSWIGDLLLSYSSTDAFRAGLVAFLLAHLAYVVAFLVRGVDGIWAVTAGAGAAGAAIVVWGWLRPHLRRPMRRPVAAYVVVISAMVTFAFGTVGHDPDPRIAAGAVAFFVSDLFVARNRFVSPGFVNRAVGLPTYYLGQVLLALSSGG
jgi:uncharacterized membrane protein YhhN